MTYTEYIADITGLKNRIEKTIISIIPDFEKEMLRELLNWIENNLGIKAGSFIVEAETVNIINNFTQDYLDIINENKLYNSAVTKFLKFLPNMSDTMKEFQEEVNGISWQKAGVKPVQNIVINEIMDAYTDNGLNAGFVNPLRDQIYQNVVAGTSLKEAKQNLKDYILSGKDKTGKLAQYLTQTAQQSVDSYEGAINKKLMTTFDYNYYIMDGSLIETSSPQCKKAINEYQGLINEEAWKVLEPIAEKNGLPKGTTFDSLTFNKFHWGCRHSFTPAILKVGDKIGTHEFVNGNPVTT
jgi:hypothetical protein